ncbi:IS200/IS605 family transposase [Erysipelothrix anatis]|uniref:IS200/IS605 family transposase n=1 Tax=Erysipelothrix anatis TaxID=2683713 RepID=UPI001356F952|nr:IS200/IS605 family transposase [Erysipelothrix anatis]
MKDTHSLSHTTWCCKYHVVFAPKYRRQAFYGSRRLEIGTILRELCRWKGINIIEAEVCVDHIHMLIEIPPKMSVSGVMGFLKGKSSLMIYDRWGDARYKYRSRQFWCRGYYVDTVGKNTKKIKEYIANQLKEDKLASQLTLEDIDPFTGSKK